MDDRDDDMQEWAYQQELEHRYFEEVSMSDEKTEHEAFTVEDLIKILEKYPKNAEIIVSDFGRHNDTGALIEYASNKNVVEINKILRGN